MKTILAFMGGKASVSTYLSLHPLALKHYVFTAF